MHRRGTYNVIHKNNITLFGIKIWVKVNSDENVLTCSKCDLRRICERRRIYILCFNSILRGYYFKMPKNILVYKHQKYKICRTPINLKQVACEQCELGSFSKCHLGDGICHLLRGNVYFKKINANEE